MSRDKAPVIDEMQEKTAALSPTPRDFIKDPYVLEFLGMPDSPHFRESELEQAIIQKLREFILELGKGFAFVARQQRISTDTSEFFIDLVFYNYILKCFVLVDLKTGKLTHQDIGQMDMYVRLYEDTMKGQDDNPTIGIILSRKKTIPLSNTPCFMKTDSCLPQNTSFICRLRRNWPGRLRREKAQLEQKTRK